MDETCLLEQSATDAGINVAHNTSAGDKVNSNTIVDLDSFFNIQEYFDSNPIVGKNYDLIFNVEFQKLYEFALGTNSIFPDFIQMENIELEIKLHKLVFTRVIEASMIIYIWKVSTFK